MAFLEKKYRQAADDKVNTIFILIPFKEST